MSTRRQLQAEFTRQAKRKLRAARARLTAERKRIRKARTLKATKLRSLCRGSKARARARAKAVKEQLRAEGKREAERILAAAKGKCDRRREQNLKAEGKHLHALELEAERAKERWLAERLGGALARQDAQTKSSRAERRQESDEEVARNIAEELRPVWERVKRRITERPNMSRTEAFEHWVHEHSDELAAELDAAAESDVAKQIRQHEAEQRRVEAVLKKPTITEADLVRLGITCDEVHSLGFDCDDPDDVAAAYQALEHPSGGGDDEEFYNEPEPEPEPWLPRMTLGGAHVDAARAQKAATADLEKLEAMSEREYNLASGARAAPLLSALRRQPDAMGLLDAAQAPASENVRAEVRRLAAASGSFRPVPRSQARARESADAPGRNETYAQASKRLLEQLAHRRGWRVRADLKTPYAENDELRLYFRPQGTWWTRSGQPMSSARSLDVDRRRMPADDLVELAGRFL